MLTPYQFASNRPIDGIDLDGLEYSPYLQQKSMDVALYLVTADYVYDNTVSKKIPFTPVSVTYGKSTLFNFRGDQNAEGDFDHLGVTFTWSSNPVKGVMNLAVPIAHTFSVGMVGGLDAGDGNGAQASNYSGFFVGLGVSGDGIGGNHSGWISGGNYVSSSTLTLNWKDALIAAATQTHDVSVGVNIDFFFDGRSELSRMEQFNAASKQFWNDINSTLDEKGIKMDPELKNQFQNALDKIKENIKSGKTYSSESKRENPRIIGARVRNKESERRKYELERYKYK